MKNVFSSDNVNIYVCKITENGDVIIQVSLPKSLKTTLVKKISSLEIHGYKSCNIHNLKEHSFTCN